MDKRDAILDAALDLFAERGFYGTAVPLIAERADDMQKLLKTNAVARHKVLEVQQERLGAEHDLKAAVS